jgi:hypothetical protein
MRQRASEEMMTPNSKECWYRNHTSVRSSEEKRHIRTAETAKNVQLARRTSIGRDLVVS